MGRRVAVVGAGMTRFVRRAQETGKELAWEASKAGFRCGETPITFVERRRGASKLSARVIVESAILPWRLAARPE